MAAIPRLQPLFASEEETTQIRQHSRTETPSFGQSRPKDRASPLAADKSASGASLTRTAELELLTDRLEREIDRRFNAEQALRDMERRLVEAERMQIVAWQAASAVHDLNNLMTIAIQGTDWLLTKVEGNERMKQVVQEVRTAGQRAADLVQRMLASARPHPPAPKICNLNDIFFGAESMMRHVLGPDRELRIVAAAALGSVRVDPREIEHMMLNLVANARDALPKGGKVTIATRNADASDRKSGSACRPRGPSVVIEVRDDGVGMEPSMSRRIFEPFFTTKHTGQGTGLGLWSVLRAVREHDGDIFVDSEPGSGTTFEIYLPRVIRGLPIPSVPPMRMRVEVQENEEE